ncbi:uncharacterized protein LOC143084412 [Mytilus galloprovincialis]|uniref:Uncharacterized protein n=2 Tax=Mytilus galloprovincialis TaxID=29158 RepID=A0A8B6E0H8_MYTGA|nr:Hypothetical predicted protein [Mytilus galloprovincialis]
MYSAYIMVVGVVIICCVAQDNQKSTNKIQGDESHIHRLIKRGSSSFLNTYGRVPWKRTKIDNHINNIPDYQPAAAEKDVGSGIMDEFMLFLALKETGMLDLCMNTANSIF